jgi:hypothetical protein
MVYVSWSWRFSEGKAKEAGDWIQRFYSYIEKKYGIKTISMRPLTPGQDQGDKILGVTIYDSLAAWAEHMEKMPRDAGRNAFLKEIEDKKIFVHGSYTRAVCTEIYPAAGA